MEVHINSIDGNQMAAKILGRFNVDGQEFDFTAIAFGRIGGQNVGVEISKNTEVALTRMGHDPERVIMDLQRHLLQGEIKIPEDVPRESFADS